MAPRNHLRLLPDILSRLKTVGFPLRYINEKSEAQDFFSVCERILILLSELYRDQST